MCVVCQVLQACQRQPSQGFPDVGRVPQTEEGSSSKGNGSWYRSCRGWGDCWCPTSRHWSPAPRYWSTTTRHRATCCWRQHTTFQRGSEYRFPRAMAPGSICSVDSLAHVSMTCKSILLVLRQFLDGWGRSASHPRKGSGAQTESSQSQWGGGQQEMVPWGRGRYLTIVVEYSIVLLKHCSSLRNWKCTNQYYKVESIAHNS